MTDTKTQHERFVEKARELETDDDEKRFDENMKRLAKAGGKKDDPKEQ